MIHGRQRHPTQPGSDDVPDADGRPSRAQVRSLALLLVTGIGLFVCFRLAVPFLPALTWALVLAVLFAPFQGWLEVRIRHPSLAALTAVLVIVLIVVVPATFVLQRLVVQSAQGAQLIEARVKSGEWRHTFEAQPGLAVLVDRIEQQLDLPGSMAAFSSWLSGAAGSIVKGSMFQLIGFCITFYLLFFFLRDRQMIRRTLVAHSPLPPADMDRLLVRIGDTVFATVYGTLVVSSVQGLLGGLMFWWLGLSAPLFWGVVMALLAVVPVLGAFLVWVPAALFLVLDGSAGKALILVLWGMLVVGTADNLLRPVLVGKRLKLHTVLAFMSVVGGLITFGPAGLILGPMALTLTTELLKTWSHRNEATTASAGSTEADH